MTRRMIIERDDLVDLRGANRMYRSLIIRNNLLYIGGASKIERYEGGLTK